MEMSGRSVRFSKTWRADAPAVHNFALRVADMIVVRAERNVRALQRRIAALDDGGDILRETRAHDLIVCVDVERQLHAVEAERRQRILRVRFSFELAVLDWRPAEQQLEEFVRGGDDRSDRQIEALRRGEICRRDRSSACGWTHPFRSTRRLRGADRFSDVLHRRLRRRNRLLDVRVGVGGREEPGLELRRRWIDTALQHPMKERRVGAGVGGKC